ncbi:Aste57867_437 [Aphanomyces stellatus]|uniref:Aste57867_437 protein n=1 Tax=Aphanomyces stellatus TaxID=120398 RepID=A0A485K2M6_9STRA|nr:hypothetical protein As57867_000436 [Aphanomyces stellatus]VFT77662.1 Aste57867_437 [Aphanomyces stellatus]
MEPQERTPPEATEDNTTDTRFQLEAADTAIRTYIESTLEGLPPCLHCSSISLVAQAVTRALSVTLSSRVMDETLALATAGMKHLASNRHNPALADDFHALLRQRADLLSKLQARAHRIQTGWLNARFRTLSLLPALELPNFVFHEPTNVDLVASTPLDPASLAREIASYSAQLEKRLSASREQQRRAAVELLQQQQTSLARRKHQTQAKQKRVQHVQQRWEYLVTQFVRRQRQHRMTIVKAAHSRHEYAQDDDDRWPLRGRCASSYLPRNFVVTYVDRLLEHAILSATWSLEMQEGRRPRSSKPMGARRRVVVRVAMLLCPNPFGAHFGLLYQRYFAQHAPDLDVLLEWSIFDVAALDFPTQAMQRCVHAFFVCGAPDVTHTSRHVISPWYTALVGFVRSLVAQGRVVGALGRGHIVLAEALGGHVERHAAWQRAHNVIEEKVRLQPQHTQTRVRVVHTLHGEYVSALPTSPGVRIYYNVPLPGAMYTFVSTIRRAQNLLSFDGYPECSGLVFRLFSQLVAQDDIGDADRNPLLRKASSSTARGSSLALEWVSAAPSIAHKFIKLFRSATATTPLGDDTPASPTALLHDVRATPPAIFAMKASIPHADFISDTEEYIAFAANEHAHAIVLGVSLSRDHHPVVFPRCSLNDMTDVRDVFPSLFFSPRYQPHHNHANAHHDDVTVLIQQLTLLELKSLTILHSYQRRHVLKSPRLVPGTLATNSHNRLLTLLAAIKFTLGTTSPLRLVVTFPEENLHEFTHYSPDEIQVRWLAVAAAAHANDVTSLTLVSRDATFIQVLRKVQPGWTFVLALPPVTDPQDALVVRKHAKLISRVADGILLSMEHELIACEPRHHAIAAVSVADLFHEAGLQVYVNVNASETTTVLGEASGPVREQLAFLLLGIDGVFTSNPHPVQDAWKLFRDGHVIVDEVRAALTQHTDALVQLKQAQLEAESDPLAQADGYRLYAHHYYNLPLDLTESDQWHKNTSSAVRFDRTHVATAAPNTVLAHVDRLLLVDVAREVARQRQAHETHLLQTSSSSPQKRDLRLAIKTPTLERVGPVWRSSSRRDGPSRRGKRIRNLGTSFRTPTCSPETADALGVAVRHIPVPPPKAPSHGHRIKPPHTVSPMSSMETRSPSMTLGRSIMDAAPSSTSKRARRGLHCLNLPVCSI